MKNVCLPSSGTAFISLNVTSFSRVAEKAFAPMPLMPPLNVALVRLRQLEKASESIEVSSAGNSISVIADLAKASSRMLVRRLGSLTLFRFVAPKKACSPMAITFSGTVND